MKFLVFATPPPTTARYRRCGHHKRVWHLSPSVVMEDEGGAVFDWAALGQSTNGCD